MARLVVGRSRLARATALAVLGLVAWSGFEPRPVETRSATPAGELNAVLAADMTFSISGDVAGLYPGATRTLSLVVANPFPDPIRVITLSTAVGTPDRAGCSASVLSVSGLGTPVDIPAGQNRPATVSAAMALSTPDACQGAAFPLTFSGTAEGTSSTPATATRLRVLPAVAIAGRNQPVATGSFSALLTDVSGRRPLVGLTVEFTASGRAICTATTTAAGRASCTGMVPASRLVSLTSYQGDFRGNQTHAASSGRAALVLIRR